MTKPVRSRRPSPAAKSSKTPARAGRAARAPAEVAHTAPAVLVQNRLPEPLLRYHRQMILPHIGRVGQERLGRSTVAVIGLGALGSVSADFLARAGVGRLILIDRDCLEITNLQRQVLYTEADAQARKPKAIAAAERLQEANSSIELDPRVEDLTAGKLEKLVQESDLLIDGCDNFETRYLLNDACVKYKKPWIYGAAVGSAGLCLCILPGKTPCLRCLFETPPPPGAAPTCDTVGVLGPVTGVIGAWQAGEAIKLLTGNAAALSPRLLSIDLWSDQLRGLNTRESRRADCPCCGKRKFEFLTGRHKNADAVLCGRDGVQIAAPVVQAASPGGAEKMDLEALAHRLRKAVDGDIEINPFFLRFAIEGLGVTVFHDGRSIFQGTTDVTRARTVHARILGH